MNARSGADEPKEPVRRRLADLIEPTVPQQERRLAGQQREATEPRAHPQHREASEHPELPEGSEPPESGERTEPDERSASHDRSGPGSEPCEAAEDHQPPEHHRIPEPHEPTATPGPTESHESTALHGPTAPREPARHRDPLEHPDPRAAADAAALENLLRCWVRETAPARPRNGVLRIPLPASGTALLVPVRHWSPVGWHRFDPPHLEGAPGNAAPLQAVAVAVLIGRETAHAGREAGDGAGREAADSAQGADDSTPVHDNPVDDNPVDDRVAADGDAQQAAKQAAARRAEAREGAMAAEHTALVGRVADSVQRTARFLADRRDHPEPPPGTGPFLDGEQALIFGHPLHPTPKSREGLSEAEEGVYSPELRGSFPLHWMAVHRSVLAGDSAWTDRGKPVSAAQLALRMSGQALTGRLPEEYVPLPLHPWQAREARHSPAVRALLDAGLLHDLGQAGEPWSPTSSVRTVFRPDSVAMLKLSVGLRITNSRRENLRKELLRGVEVHRLLRGDLGRAWRAAHPGFDIVRDPAWLGVDVPGEGRLPGFDTVIRHNPFGAGDDAVCLAGLTAPVPTPPGAGPNGPPDAGADADDGAVAGAGTGVLRSRLGRVVHALAQDTRRPVGAVAAEWFLRYLDAVVRPVLWLDAHGGIALEAHQQNTLVLLDAQGWPRGGRYRDNQGYYFRTSHREVLSRRLPGARLGVESDTFVADDVTDERFAYYLGINNVLGLIGAFGSQQLADERLLLAAFRRFLQGAAREEPASPLPALLLESPTLRCKANLLTRLHGMDELVGPVDTQSVYVTLVNPLTL
ncbi:IucA/IucC family protein [Streptomyces smyrnaeus]|uniref:IucA/IucC family protein n=1 Tax=Streptomyces smyrnaeus TaxID=1387713 RepID=UPI0036A2D5DC